MFYHNPSIRCIIKLTAVMPNQHVKPKKRGFTPDFMSFTMLVLMPMAAMAIMMKNLLTSLRNENMAEQMAYPVEPSLKMA